MAVDIKKPVPTATWRRPQHHLARQNQHVGGSFENRTPVACLLVSWTPNSVPDPSTRTTTKTLRPDMTQYGTRFQPLPMMKAAAFRAPKRRELFLSPSLPMALPKAQPVMRPAHTGS